MITKKTKYKISIIGLGYVGLPLAVEFSKKFVVVGYDLDENRIKELKSGYDRTKEIDNDNLNLLKNIIFASDQESIADSNIYIITVPTPVDRNNKPDLHSLISASKMVGRYLSIDDIVIYESTVFPGCTEEICVPELEKTSGLKYNTEFFCGYSPERINPGDKTHTLTNIPKIVSGSNVETLKIVNYLYQSILESATFKASSIVVAEAAKVIENTQRDVNIALINELSFIFDKLNINTSEILEAASTKWNFMNFKPGLVGGHCIGVDPYYLTHKALEVGYHPEIILAGRKINDSMGTFIAEKTISKLTRLGINPIGAKICILGVTFKENCSDLRNTKVLDIKEKLVEYQCEVKITDSYAIESEVKHKFNLSLSPLENIEKQDAIIIAVAHNDYKDFSDKDWLKMLKPGGLLIDVKSLYSTYKTIENNFDYWSL